MAHYTNPESLKKPALHFEDSIEFSGTGLVYQVREDHLMNITKGESEYGYYLHIFESLGISDWDTQNKFCGIQYGYPAKGTTKFPSCKEGDFPALKRLVMALMRLSEGQMTKVTLTLLTWELRHALINIKSREEELTKLKEDYQIDFLKRIKILYSIIKENSNMSESWNEEMYYGIGTIEDESSDELKAEIALGENPLFIDLLCHSMMGCLVLQKKLTCNIGGDGKETADIPLIIEKVANIIGLGVEFSRKEKNFRGDLYYDRYATFFIKK